MKNKEIEIKLLFKNKKKIIDKLKPDIKFLRKVAVLDRYYCSTKFNIKNKNDFFRIRETDGNIELTYKGQARNKKGIILRTELTVKISSSKIMERILFNAGFKKISEHYGKKEYWFYDGAEVVFVEFIKPAKLTFMEIEASSEKKIKNILKKIDDCISKMEEEDFNIFDKANKKTI